MVISGFPIACAWSPVVFMLIMVICMVNVVISGYVWLSVVICIVISDCMHGICGYISGCMHGVCGYICMVIVVISGCMHGNSSAMFKLVRADTKASKDVCPSVVCKMKRLNKCTWWVQYSEEKG